MQYQTVEKTQVTVRSPYSQTVCRDGFSVEGERCDLALHPHLEGVLMIPTHTDGEVQAPWSTTFGAFDETPTNSEESGLVEPLRRLLVTPEEAAEILRIGRTTVYDLVRSGELESVQIKSCLRIPLAALERFVQRLQDGL